MPLAQPLGNEQLDGLAQQLLAGVAEQTLDLTVHEDDLPAAIDHDHAARRRLHGGPEPRFGALACRDVDHRGEHEHPLVGLDRVQPDLDGDLAAIFPQRVELSPRAHSPGLRADEEVGPECGVPTAEPLGDQTLDGLAHDLLASVAEQPLGLPIHEGDRAGAIDHHPAGRRLHHGAEPGVRQAVRGQPAFEPLPSSAAHEPRTDGARCDQHQRHCRHAPDEGPHRSQDAVAGQLHDQDPRRATDHRRASKRGPATRSGVPDQTLAAPHIHRRAFHARRQIGPHISLDVADQQRRVGADQLREPPRGLGGRLNAAPVDDVRCRLAADRHGDDDREHQRVAARAQRAERHAAVHHGRRQGLGRVRIQPRQRAAHGEETLTGGVPQLDRGVERVLCREPL